MRLRPLLLASLSGLILSGCASDIKDMPASGRYMVVTRFGNGLTVEKLGSTVFNSYSRIYEDDTDIAKLFQDGTVAVLTKDSHWTYAPTDVSMDPPKYDGDYGDYRSDLIGDWHQADARILKLKQAAHANHVDVLIYIIETIGGNAHVPLGPNNQVMGRGLTKRTLLFRDDMNWAFLAYQIVVYDVRTWESREYSTTFMTPYPQVVWPEFITPKTPLPADTPLNAKMALANIEPPSDLPFALCFLGLTDITHDPSDRTRAYACAQHYGMQSIGMSSNGLPAYWLTQPEVTHHWNTHQH